MLLKQQLKWNLSVTYLAHSLRRRIYFFGASWFGQFAGVVVVVFCDAFRLVSEPFDLFGPNCGTPRLNEIASNLNFLYVEHIRRWPNGISMLNIFLLFRPLMTI